MRKPKTLSVVIPVYNEENLVEKTIKKVFSANTLKLKLEIVLVDDGSTDKTPKILRKFKGKKGFRVILKKKNKGKGAALKTGFLATTGDLVLVQDADLEYDPIDYPKLIKPFVENQADVVYGSRLVTAAPHRVLYFWHYLANKALTTFSNMLTNLNLTDMETGYKVFRGEIIRSLAKGLESHRFGFEPEITAKIAKGGYKIFEVGISYSGRTYEEGKKIGWQDGARALWEIIKFNLLD